MASREACFSSAVRAAREVVDGGWECACGMVEFSIGPDAVQSLVWRLVCGDSEHLAVRLNERIGSISRIDDLLWIVASYLVFFGNCRMLTSVKAVVRRKPCRQLSACSLSLAAPDR